MEGSSSLGFRKTTHWTFKMCSLDRGHEQTQCTGGREDSVPHTHRLGAVSAAVPRLILGQPLLLLVQGPRLQDHFLQLKGGVAVQAAFLWSDRVLSLPGRCHLPQAWSHPFERTDLHWARSPAPPSSRSDHPTTRWPVTGQPACPEGWRIGVQGSQ